MRSLAITYPCTFVKYSIGLNELHRILIYPTASDKTSHRKNEQLQDDIHRDAVDFLNLGTFE